jgi:hypothetical protein
VTISTGRSWQRGSAQQSDQLGAGDPGHLLVGDQEIERIATAPLDRLERVLEGGDPVPSS